MSPIFLFTFPLIKSLIPVFLYGIFSHRYCPLYLYMTPCIITSYVTKIPTSSSSSPSTVTFAVVSIAHPHDLCLFDVCLYIVWSVEILISRSIIFCLLCPAPCQHCWIICQSLCFRQSFSHFYALRHLLRRPLYRFLNEDVKESMQAYVLRMIVEMGQIIHAQINAYLLACKRTYLFILATDLLTPLPP